VPMHIVRWLSMAALLCSACATPTLYIAPAHEGQDRKAVALLDCGSEPVRDRHVLSLRKIDDVPVDFFNNIYLSPGWHSFRYGYRQYKECKRWRYTQGWTDYGVGVLRTPGRDRASCLEPVYEDVLYSGWYRFEAGARYEWTDVQPRLLESPDAPLRAP
jgi:hypothetical protein